MDAFSEILSGVRLSGAVFFSAEFSAPWGLSAPASKVVAEQSPTSPTKWAFRDRRSSSASADIYPSRRWPI